MKKTYEAPALKVEGSVEALTAANPLHGGHLDATYPRHYPKKKLTYS